MIGIIDYGAGNITSVEHAVKRLDSIVSKSSKNLKIVIYARR